MEVNFIYWREVKGIVSCSNVLEGNASCWRVLEEIVSVGRVVEGDVER